MKLIEKKDFNRIFFLLASFIFVAFTLFTIWGHDGLISLYRLHQWKGKLIAQNRELMKDNLWLKMEQKSLLKPERIEARAHESLGLVHPDETLFILKTTNLPLP